MSPTETRMHIHVHSPTGEAKFWLEPRIELAQNRGLNLRELNALLQVVKEHSDEIRKAWQEHFGG